MYPINRIDYMILAWNIKTKIIFYHRNTMIDLKFFILFKF